MPTKQRTVKPPPKKVVMVKQSLGPNHLKFAMMVSFVLMVVVVAITILTWFGKVDGDGYLVIIGTIVGGILAVITQKIFQDNRIDQSELKLTLILSIVLMIIISSLSILVWFDKINADGFLGIISGIVGSIVIIITQKLIPDEDD